MNMNMNLNPFTSEEADNAMTQSSPFAFLGYQGHQMQSESSSTISVSQERDLFNDAGLQQFVVNPLPSGFIYRGRASSRGNTSTACSLSPKDKVPQTPDNMLARLSSTKNTMSGGQMLDESSQDEGNMNEFQEKITKSSKNMVDGQYGQVDERENSLEIME